MARQFSAPRRTRRWNNFPGSGAATVITGAGTTLHVGSLAFAVPETIVRIIGDGMLLMDDNAIAADDEVIITLGLGIFSTDAVAAGAGSVPDPAGEPEFPWLWWKSMPFFAVAAAVSASEGSQVMRYRIDVKSQRIVRPGRSLALVAEYANIGGNPEIAWSQPSLRVLTLES